MIYGSEYGIRICLKTQWSQFVLAGPQHVRRLVHVPHEGGGPASGLCRLRRRARLQVRCFTALDRGARRSAAVCSVRETIVELQRELQVVSCWRPRAQEPVPESVQGVPALQAPPAHRAVPRRRQAHRLRRARAQRGRLPGAARLLYSCTRARSFCAMSSRRTQCPQVDVETIARARSDVATLVAQSACFAHADHSRARVPGRLSDRLRGGLPERAQSEGHAQRDTLRAHRRRGHLRAPARREQQGET